MDFEKHMEFMAKQQELMAEEQRRLKAELTGLAAEQKHFKAEMAGFAAQNKHLASLVDRLAADQIEFRKQTERRHAEIEKWQSRADRRFNGLNTLAKIGTKILMRHDGRINALIASHERTEEQAQELMASQRDTNAKIDRLIAILNKVYTNGRRPRQ